MRKAAFGCVGVGLVLALASACTGPTSNESPRGENDASGPSAPSGGGDGSDGGAVVAPASFTPSNIAAPSAEGTDEVTLRTAACTIDTDKGTISCAEDQKFAFKLVDQTTGGANASRVALFVARSWRIEQRAQITVVGNVPFVLWAPGVIDIEGGVDLTGGGFAMSPSGMGGGPGGGEPSQNHAGAGGGGYCGVGGAGTPDGALAASGGKAWGTKELSPLVAGASGGGFEGGAMHRGGRGGGAIHVASATGIIVGMGAVISVAGRGGRASGGAGGSGGSILIEAPEVDIAGTLAANGGGGSVFDGNSAGADGRPSATAAPASKPTGGSGSAAAGINGGDAQATIAAGGDNGAGGGGAGRIRINTKTGAARIATTATLSPSLTTECVTQGALK